MSTRVPVLTREDMLIASVQEELSDGDILELQRRILADVDRRSARFVLLDVSVLEVLDSFGTRMLSEIAAAVRLRGARMAIVGIQPEVALAMVLLGLTLEDVPTARDLDHGVALLRGAA